METNKEWLKRTRAKRIAKIQRRRALDNYIRGRVYMIILALLMTIGVLGLALHHIDTLHEDISTLHVSMGKILTRTMDDELLQDNVKLARAIDSLKITIFAYNRRHQGDAKTIQALLEQNKPKRIHNRIEFPDYIDTTKYDFEFDTITGLINNRNQILIKLEENEEDSTIDSDPVSLLDH